MHLLQSGLMSGVSQMDTHNTSPSYGLTSCPLLLICFSPKCSDFESDFQNMSLFHSATKRVNKEEKPCYNLS